MTLFLFYKKKTCAKRKKNISFFDQTFFVFVIKGNKMAETKGEGEREEEVLKILFDIIGEI